MITLSLLSCLRLSKLLLLSYYDFSLAHSSQSEIPGIKIPRRIGLKLGSNSVVGLAIAFAQALSFLDGVIISF